MNNEDNPFDKLSETERQLVPEVISELENNMMEVWKKFEDFSDMYSLKRFGHSVKGFGRQYRLSDLADWGKIIEDAADQNDISILAKYLPIYPIVVKASRQKADRWLPKH